MGKSQMSGCVCGAVLLLFLILGGTANSSAIPCVARERDALLHFKASLSDPTNLLSSWQGVHCCQWEGVRCDNLTGHVVMLDLSTPYFRCQRSNMPRLEEDNCYDLYGSQYVEARSVNPSLKQLQHLTYLDLSGNHFHGSPIPTFLASMPRLTHLSVFFAGFGGTIPSNLGNLTHLHFLDLSWNYFLPPGDMNWISGLGSLEHLDLSSVYLDNNTAHKLFQVLHMLPSLLRLYLDDCGLTEVLVPHHVNLSTIHVPPKLQVLSLSYNGLTVPDLDALLIQNLTSLVHLDLSSNNLDSVPSWFRNFHKLHYLSLLGCGLHGPIPNAFQNMLSIKFLDLSWNQLDSVPAWFHKFEKLKHLDLSWNVFQGPVPDAIRNMSSIEVLDLSHNHFTSVPSWSCNLEKLVHLDLSWNVFRGPLPHAIRNLPSIEVLDLSHNNFTSVPSWLVELKTLLHLDLSWNQLTPATCSLSLILTKMCHLKSLYFSGNMLRGEPIGHYALSACTTYDLERMDLSENGFNDSLPTWLAQLENLEYLNLAGNLFHGPIISFSFEKLSKLKALRLSSNYLEGVLPNSTGHLVNLINFDISNNFFKGTIPQSLFQLASLISVDLSNNCFNGTLPSNFGQLVNVYDLDLSNNYFNGTIPSSFGQLVNLEYLNISINKLHGNIPADFGQLVNLQELDLSSNNLDGTPTTLWKNWSSIMPQIRHLSLSDNQISGSLPEHIGYMMPNLEYLLLENNLINGSIPISLCQIRLVSLDLSKNRLTGEIPNCWNDDHEYLEEINLSSNKLSGAFPSSFGNLSSLSWLHLNNNSLQGELPVSLENLQQLLILDIGENKLSGSIQSWTANTFPFLQILRLRQNLLSGSIPSQLCQLSSLKILDLSRNNLQGSIPRCIGNLQGMTLDKSSDKSIREFADAPGPTMQFAEPPAERWSTEDVKQVMKGMELDYTKNLVWVVNMDLSDNNLIGVIPEEITLLDALLGLDLSNNQLKGEIPKMIGDMKSLESFDVSNNQLSGTLPNSMPALTSLSHLNLSHNNFSGPIPTSNQFLTYDSSTYVGNSYLCGLPLPNKCPSDTSHQVHGSRGFEDDDDKTDKLEKWMFYFVVAVGFATGFWGVIGVLLFKKNWRHAYFRWVEDRADAVYMEIAIKMAKLQKWMVRNRVDG